MNFKDASRLLFVYKKHFALFVGKVTVVVVEKISLMEESINHKFKWFHNS
jgi:hypothetical protein